MNVGRKISVFVSKGLKVNQEMNNLNFLACEMKGEVLNILYNDTDVNLTSCPSVGLPEGRFACSACSVCPACPPLPVSVMAEGSSGFRLEAVGMVSQVVIGFFSVVVTLPTYL